MDSEKPKRTYKKRKKQPHQKVFWDRPNLKKLRRILRFYTQAQAARLFGVSPRRIGYVLEIYNIDPPKYARYRKRWRGRILTDWDYENTPIYTKFLTDKEFYAKMEKLGLDEFGKPKKSPED